MSVRGLKCGILREGGGNAHKGPEGLSKGG